MAQPVTFARFSSRKNPSRYPQFCLNCVNLLFLLQNICKSERL